MLTKILTGIVIVLVIGAVVIVAAFFEMGRRSSAGEPPGLTADGALQPCPESPNCVSSQADPSDAQHYAPPLDVPPADAAARIKQVMNGLGATLVEERDGYLAFTVTSSIFKFVDDVEFLIGEDGVHIRSASRVGHSDLGANRKRVEAIRAAL